jgi:hypothetical protein
LVAVIGWFAGLLVCWLLAAGCSLVGLLFGCWLPLAALRSASVIVLLPGFHCWLVAGWLAVACLCSCSQASVWLFAAVFWSGRLFCFGLNVVCLSLSVCFVVALFWFAVCFILYCLLPVAVVGC